MATKPISSAFWIVAASVAVLASPSAFSATWTDIDSLHAALKAVGTGLKEYDKCEKGYLGFYAYKKGEYDDVIVCVNNIDKDDPDEYWDVVSHESAHVMQTCTGDYALNDKYINTAYRELHAINPTSVQEMQEYGSWDKRQEVEARWMQLQQPAVVIELLKKICGKQ
jgi:hypothetical protein